jgi:hypothetical protein
MPAIGGERNHLGWYRLGEPQNISRPGWVAGT